jgi:hypothetical protein
MAVPTQQLLTEGWAAISTRFTCGCGVLLVASLGGLSVEKAFERQVAAGEASKERAAENARPRQSLIHDDIVCTS